MTPFLDEIAVRRRTRKHTNAAEAVRALVRLALIARGHYLKSRDDLRRDGFCDEAHGKMVAYLMAAKTVAKWTL